MTWCHSEAWCILSRIVTRVCGSVQILVYKDDQGVATTRSIEGTLSLICTFLTGCQCNSGFTVCHYHYYHQPI